MTLEKHFFHYYKQIIGNEQLVKTPHGLKRIIYTDWTASGRLYGPIEHALSHEIGPYIANTHTETSATGHIMTLAYHKAVSLIKKHVHAGKDDILISYGSGMTGAVNKLQRILGLRLHERYQSQIQLSEEDRPVVFITHMEHHSNHTSWLETLADVAVIPHTREGWVDSDALPALLRQYSHRRTRIAAITSCSNVTGIKTPYHTIAGMMHDHGGYCFVDFACSAPYVNIDMHPNDREYLDAIYFSPHKFLGGPGSPGILIFNKKLYQNKIPDNPGGGTVVWTNPWGGHRYFDDIEAREDGGTPAFMQTIRAALCVKLKEEMEVEKILAREAEINAIFFAEMEKISRLHLLAEHIHDRLSIFSFYIDGLPYNLVVRLLNDRFGIQARGGCSCAGTYGHYLLNIDPATSCRMTDKLDTGDWSEKLGWVRLSFHPTTPDEEVYQTMEALRQIAEHGDQWALDYRAVPGTNNFRHKYQEVTYEEITDSWFGPAAIAPVPAGAY